MLGEIKSRSLEVKRLLTNDEFLTIAENQGVKKS
jgi:hypothetical protein